MRSGNTIYRSFACSPSDYDVVGPRVKWHTRTRSCCSEIKHWFNWQTWPRNVCKLGCQMHAVKFSKNHSVHWTVSLPLPEWVQSYASRRVSMAWWRVGSWFVWLCTVSEGFIHSDTVQGEPTVKRTVLTLECIPATSRRKWGTGFLTTHTFIWHLQDVKEASIPYLQDNEKPSSLIVI